MMEPKGGVRDGHVIWYPWFAWHPVRLESGEWVWWADVQRQWRGLHCEMFSYRRHKGAQ